ncbi:MAG: DSD1 family PLP-dependent enzyme, partial [Chloroflexota bacterium]
NALTVLATIISRPVPNRAIADVGMKGMATDHGLPELVGVPGAKLTKLAEEHAIIELTDPSIELEPGDRVEFIPGHCCTTINLYDNLYGMRGERLEVVWPIAGRGKLR